MVAHPARGGVHAARAVQHLERPGPAARQRFGGRTRLGRLRDGEAGRAEIEHGHVRLDHVPPLDRRHRHAEHTRVRLRGGGDVGHRDVRALRAARRGSDARASLRRPALLERGEVLEEEDRQRILRTGGARLATGASVPPASSVRPRPRRPRPRRDAHRGQRRRGRSSLCTMMLRKPPPRSRKSSKPGRGCQGGRGPPQLLAIVHAEHLDVVLAMKRDGVVRAPARMHAARLRREAHAPVGRQPCFEVGDADHHVVDAGQHGGHLLRVVIGTWSMAQDLRDQVVGLRPAASKASRPRRHSRQGNRDAISRQRSASAPRSGGGGCIGRIREHARRVAATTHAEEHIGDLLGHLLPPSAASARTCRNSPVMRGKTMAAISEQASGRTSRSRQSWAGLRLSGLPRGSAGREPAASASVRVRAIRVAGGGRARGCMTGTGRACPVGAPRWSAHWWPTAGRRRPSPRRGR